MISLLLFVCHSVHSGDPGRQILCEILRWDKGLVITHPGLEPRVAKGAGDYARSDKDFIDVYEGDIVHPGSGRLLIMSTGSGRQLRYWPKGLVFVPPTIEKPLNHLVPAGNFAGAVAARIPSTGAIVRAENCIVADGIVSQHLLLDSDVYAEVGGREISLSFDGRNKMLPFSKRACRIQIDQRRLSQAAWEQDGHLRDGKDYLSSYGLNAFIRVGTEKIEIRLISSREDENSSFLTHLSKGSAEPSSLPNNPSDGQVCAYYKFLVDAFFATKAFRESRQECDLYLLSWLMRNFSIPYWLKQYVNEGVK